MNRIVHFEIHAEDPERAINFYTKLFNWEIQKWENSGSDYWMIMTAPKDSKEMGINGGMMKRVGPGPEKNACPTAFVCTVLVEDLDKTAKEIIELGGVESMPKFAIPGMAWQAYYRDTEGNIFGIHQPDKEAK